MNDEDKILPTSFGMTESQKIKAMKMANRDKRSLSFFIRQLIDEEYNRRRGK